MYFEDSIDDSKYCGHLYGLGSTSFFQNGIPFESYMTPQSLAATAAAVGQQTPQHNSQNSASQSSLSTLGHGNNHNSASTPNLTSIPTSNGAAVPNDSSKSSQSLPTSLPLEFNRPVYI